MIPSAPITAIALLALAIWVTLLVARGGFWRCAERDDRDEPAAGPLRWPSVVAVVPARNEADMLAGIRSGRCWGRSTRGRSRSSWSTTTATTARWRWPVNLRPAQRAG